MNSDSTNAPWQKAVRCHSNAHVYGRLTFLLKKVHKLGKCQYFPLLDAWSWLRWDCEDYSLHNILNFSQSKLKSNQCFHVSFEIDWMNEEIKQCVRLCKREERKGKSFEFCWRKPVSEKVSLKLPLSGGGNSVSFISGTMNLKLISAAGKIPWQKHDSWCIFKKKGRKSKVDCTLRFLYSFMQDTLKLFILFSWVYTYIYLYISYIHTCIYCMQAQAVRGVWKWRKKRNYIISQQVSAKCCCSGTL